MLPEPHYVRESVDRNLLLASPLPGIFWTPSIASKLEHARGATTVPMSLADHFVGPYERLKHVRKLANKFTPGVWSGTEIHHIVEHHHLQFLGVLQPFTKHSYDHHEPCVVLGRRDHNLIMENAIGDAVRTVLGGDRGVDFLEAFKVANPGAADLPKDELGRLSAGWVVTQEADAKSGISRRQIRDWLIEVYALAYQDHEFAALRSVALSVIRGVPL